MLNVQWRWNMPTVGDPDKVAAGNRQDFLSGLDSIAAGLIKSGENQRADEKQQWLENTTAQKFAHQVEQDQLAQMNRNREFWQQKALNDARLKQMEQELAQKKQQQEWMDKMYANYFGDVSPELKALREKFGNSSDAALVMNGLNPLFMK